MNSFLNFLKAWTFCDRHVKITSDQARFFVHRNNYRFSLIIYCSHQYINISKVRGEKGHSLTWTNVDAILFYSDGTFDVIM